MGETPMSKLHWAKWGMKKNGHGDSKLWSHVDVVGRIGRPYVKTGRRNVVA